MAVVLMVGRHVRMAKAAEELLDDAGHRSITAIGQQASLEAVGDNRHDLVLIGPGVPPPDRNEIQAAATAARPDIPVLHVRSAEDVETLLHDIQRALDGERD